MTQRISLSQIAARRITSPHNRDFVFLLVGERGSGKSMSALYLAHKIAEEVAKIKGGTWKDYFTIEKSCSIIDPTDLFKKMTNIQKGSVLLLDDAGSGWGARQFMSRQSQKLNSVLQTVRTQNAAILITCVDLSHIDVQVRGMASFYGEIAESHHGEGYNLMKVMKQKRLNRAGKSIYSHLTFHNDDGTSSKIVRWVTRMPPKELVDQYNVLRTKNAIDLMHEFNVEKEEADKSPNKWQTMVEKYGTVILEMQQQKKTLQEMAYNTGLSEYYVRKLKTSVGAF